MITMHPAEYFVLSYVEPYGLSSKDIAVCLGISIDVVEAFLRQEIDLTAEMAVRIALAFDRSAESWMNMQASHNLERAKRDVNPASVRPFVFPGESAA